MSKVYHPYHNALGRARRRVPAMAKDGGHGTVTAREWAEEVDFRAPISPESGDMDIVRQSTKGARRLRMSSYALAMALTILVPCSAATAPATAPAANPPKLTTLYSFPGTPAGGGFPEAGLIFNPTTGVMYGTTADGGAYGWGSVYELTPGTGGAWTQTVLYSFNPIGIAGDGASPQASLALSTSGVLYGTTTYGGGSSDDGTVFSLTPPTSGGSWTEKIIHSFKGGTDGAQPEAGLVLVPKSGILFGTTYAGGTTATCVGCGTVFELAPSTGGGWTEKVLYSFTGGADGGNPVASLAVATSEVVYGTTYTGGALGYGTVFSLTPAAGTWTESVIYSFTNLTDGSGPEGSVIIKYAKTGGTISALYGSTFWAGSSTGCLVGGYAAGCGTVFSLTAPTTSGAAWTFATLHTFTGAGNEGAHPSQNLFMNSGGVIYGTTFSGGSSADACFGASYPGCGTIFRLNPPAAPGGVWTPSVLHDFGGDDGGGPNGVVPGANGIFYGATYVGGTSGGYGTVFQLTPQP